LETTLAFCSAWLSPIASSAKGRRVLLPRLPMAKAAMPVVGKLVVPVGVVGVPPKMPTLSLPRLKI
jgi:hypothetical protein